MVATNEVAATEQEKAPLPRLVLSCNVDIRERPAVTRDGVGARDIAQLPSERNHMPMVEVQRPGNRLMPRSSEF